jgi:hypothetical protein
MSRVLALERDERCVTVRREQDIATLTTAPGAHASRYE